MNTYTAQQIEAIGGRAWTKNDKHRVYLNNDVWLALIGLETSHYNTGNISGATLNGEHISNAAAKDIIGAVSKVYWDAVDNQIHILIYRNRYSDQVPGWIRDAVAAAVANTAKA